ncbi:MAG TPA: hypothetical protein VFX30_04420 [bacterium]|nr:hypothetical protein [bacterium]
MKKLFPALLLLIATGLPACLPGANQTTAATGGAESNPPSEIKPVDVAANQPGPGGSMPSGTMAPGPELGGPEFVALVTGTMNIDCADGTTGKLRLTLKGKVLEKYKDGSTGECTHCYQRQLKVVYEEQSVRRWRPIALDDQGNFTDEPWEVDWSTVRLFFDRVRLWSPGETNECPADSCVERASPAELDLVPYPAIDEAPQCPAGPEPKISVLASGKAPVLTFFGTRENVCRMSGGKTKVTVRGMLSWFNEVTGIGSNHCPGQTPDCPANETILESWRLRIAYSQGGGKGPTQTVDAAFKLLAWDIGQFLWADANIVTSDPSSIRFFIFDTAEQKVIHNLPARLQEQGPGTLDACFQPELMTSQPK